MKKPYICSSLILITLTPRHLESKKIKCAICGYVAPSTALEDLTMYGIDDGTFRCSSCLIGEERRKIVSHRNEEFEVIRKKSIYRNIDK